MSLALFFAGLVISGEGAQPMKIDSVELCGLTGSVNNMAFVYERYVIVAPYAPKTLVTDESTLEEFDNHYLYLIDTKRPDLGIQKTDLKCYYPTRLIYDAGAGVAFVRGTRYEQVGGKYEPVEVISHVRINLDDNGKPTFGNAITFDVKGIDSDRANDALPDLGLSKRGNVLVFGNGATVYTFTLNEGYIYNVSLLSAAEYSQDNSISYLDVDEATNTLVAVVNRRERKEDGGVKEYSTLRFYSLRDDGTIDLKKKIEPDKFPAGTALTAGSNVVIVPGPPDPSTGYESINSAYFVTNDGSLYVADLTEGNSLAADPFDAPLRQLDTIPELAQSDPENASARILKYDAQKKILTIVKRGNISQIRRPFYGRPGRPGNIRRPFYARVAESPAVVFAQFGKKNSKLSGVKVFTDEFEEGDGLSTLAIGPGAAPSFATYSGRLYSVNLPDNVSGATLDNVGQIGERIDNLAFSPQRNSYVSINSFRANEEGTEIEQPGVLSVAKLLNNGNVPTSPGLFQSLTSISLGIDKVIPSIRRPVNIGRPAR
ncbi:MAG TPA: hypothetical protein VE262_18130 [Blastocatellia bacterium]|nr:hypothetical protein [Blastocatellia bacterium]